MNGGNPFRAAALYYASIGWWVFPIAPGSKIPLAGTRGCLDATTDRAKIRAWWQQTPSANVGIACGPSGLCVVDTDPRHGGDESWFALTVENVVPDSWTVLTPTGGQHLYFTRGETLACNTASVLGAGVDTRGLGGYVVAPPSVRPEGGYVWEASSGPRDGTAIAPLPAWVASALSSNAAKTLDLTEKVAVGSGERNKFLTQVAGRLRRGGFSPKEILGSLSIVNDERCLPPLKSSELQTIARSVGRYPPADPVSVPANGHYTPVRTVRTRVLSSYTPEAVSWLWNQRIPLGKVTILAGDGGQGKSFATLGIAAAITTGSTLPGGSPSDCRSVLVWNGEDGAADTIYMRAKNAGADIDRIEIIDETDEEGHTVPFALRDVPLLSDMLATRPEIGLVVIDPVTALLANVDSARDAEIRSALQPLSDLANRNHVAVLLVMHLKKGDETNMLHRVSGSVAFGALARSLLFLGTHAVSGRKAIDTIKHNLARGKPDPVEFKLCEEGFRWVGIAPELTAESLKLSQMRVNNRGEAAEDYLKALLADHPLDSKAVWHGARERGISDATLKRAKEKLRIVATKHGYGEGSVWTWALPTEEVQEECQLPTSSNEPLRNSSVIILEEYQKASIGSGDGAAKKLNEPLWQSGEPDLLELYTDKGIFES